MLTPHSLSPQAARVMTIVLAYARSLLVAGSFLSSDPRNGH
jgi:hypothetical protein